jgi:hypothetical protein
VPGILADQDGGPSPPGIERLNASSGLYEALLVENAVGREKYLPMDVANTGVGPAECGVEAGVVEPVSVHLVKTERYVEGGGPRFLMLMAQIIKQLVGRKGEVPYSALEEIAGERRFGGHHQLRRVRPAADLPEECPHPAEILLVRPFLRAHLGYGKAEHALKVRGER